MLQLNSLVNAIQSLVVALTRWEVTPTDKEIRDSVVQRFEYTYELCHKMLRRQLQEISASPTEVVALVYKSLIRERDKFKLIESPDAWFAYRLQKQLSVCW
jgi:nucleotidyltransferase substrate binding protein (TIGR01987 family)